jgi:hypothetical protein
MALYRAVIRGTIFQQLMENVLHFEDEDQGSAIGLGVVLRDVWCPTVRALQNSQFLWFQIIVSRKADDTDQFDPPELLTFPGQPGSLGGPAAHPALAWLFSLRKACAGKSCRGRFYLPGVHGASVLDGVAEANAMNAAGQVRDLLMQRFNRGGISFQGYSLSISERKAPYSHDFVEQIIVRNVFGIQRRRNINVGS